MGVAHLAHVGDELVGELVVGVGRPALRGEGVAGARPGSVGAWLALGLVAVAAPGAQVHLEDVEGRREELVRRAVAHPAAVAPTVARQVRGARGGAGNELGLERVRVGLVEAAPVRGADQVLVEAAPGDAGDEALPDAAGGRGLERGGPLVPTVEVADHVDGLHVRRPHGKAVALGPVLVAGGVGAHLLVASLPVPPGKEEEVVSAQAKLALACTHATLLGLVGTPRAWVRRGTRAPPHLCTNCTRRTSIKNPRT